MALGTVIEGLVLDDAADWYTFELAAPPSSADVVRIDFVGADGDLDLRVFAPNGQAIPGRSINADWEQIVLGGRGQGRYYIQVFPRFASEGNANYTLQILPPAPPQGLSLELNHTDLAELGPRNTAEATVTRSGPTTSALTVILFASDDGEVTLPSSVTIPAGQSSVTFRVTADNDGVADGYQAVDLLARATGYVDGVTSATVADPGRFRFGSIDFSALEHGGTASVVIERVEGDGGPVSVTLGSAGVTATPGVDYVPLTTVVNFADGQKRAVVPVTLKDDRAQDGRKTFNVMLSNPSGGAGLASPDSATVSIFDNETPARGNVTNLVRTTRTPLRQLRRGVFFQNIIVTNTSQLRIAGRLNVRLTGLPSGVRVLRGLSAVVSGDGVLGPGERVIIPVVFRAPSARVVRYQPLVFAA